MSSRRRRNDEDDDDDDEDDSDETPDDDQQEGQPSIAESGLFAPPGDESYGNIKFFKGLEELPKSFAKGSSAATNLTRELLKRPYAAFATRYSGGDAKTGGQDPDFFTHRILRTARLNRWVANSQFKGTGPPLVLATLPGSLIAHFGVAAGEHQARLGKHRDYPTAFGARAVTRLLAYAADEDALDEATQALGKRAVSMLLGTFTDVAEGQMSLTWLTHEGQATTLTKKRAEKGIAALDRVPAMRKPFPVPVIGMLDKPDAGREVVRFQPLSGGPMLIRYPPELHERIRDAWGRYVVGTMLVSEPENPSLPRAPQRVRTLIRIEHIRSDLDELPRPERS